MLRLSSCAILTAMMKYISVIYMIFQLVIPLIYHYANSIASVYACLRKRIVQTKPILVFYKQQTKEIKHRLCAKEIIQSNQISPSISEARACLPNQSLTPTAPRTHAPLAL
jgi:hypothetical protein